jgi:hypothetical protein
MNLMKIIKEVLDELYPEIPRANDAVRDQSVKAAIAHLDQSYAQLLSPKRLPIDFSRPESRFAYI